MNDYLDAILSITEAAESIPKKYFRKGVDVVHKADESPVTVADKATEEFIRAALAERFPDHGIFGEEFGHTNPQSPYQWIIDPIDGTRSFISGMPLFGMLVALLHDGGPVLGVIRMPELDEVYSSDGTRTTLNAEKTLSVSGIRDLGSAMIYLNEADKMMREVPNTFARLIAAGRDRRFSYDCYPHALVASGHVDACVDFDLKPYDYLSLVPIITAAGGVVSDWQGRALGLGSDGRVVSAATSQLHAQLLEILNSED